MIGGKYESGVLETELSLFRTRILDYDTHQNSQAPS